ncbi:MAG: hypothetical protein M3Y72_20370, partial [Acidobacteriota bacterium]|nr:hypothetical protein [Acidobacteriota bacterium]
MLRMFQLGVRLVPGLIATFVVAGSFAQQPASDESASGVAETVRVAEGVPLRIRITHTAHLRTGEPVTGVLTAPLYVRDRLAIPIGATVHGTVVAYVPIEHLLRKQALLNG